MSASLKGKQILGKHESKTFLAPAAKTVRAAIFFPPIHIGFQSTPYEAWRGFDHARTAAKSLFRMNLVIDHWNGRTPSA
jgi:hypothetical protein